MGKGYRDRMLGHLAKYKRTVLKVDADGIWYRNGRSYPHILPRERRELNLLHPVRSRWMRHVAEKQIKLHSDFHHLNSSQAFAFNLFFPLLNSSSNTQWALLQALGLSGRIVEWEFESVPDSKEGTNFDLWLDLELGGQAFFEVKLTEPDFGSAPNDASHREKRRNIYNARLASRGVNPSLADSAFFKCYQLFRNFCYADPHTQSTVLLVVPRENEKVRDDANEFIEAFVSPAYRLAMRVVYIEDLVSRLRADSAVDTEGQAALEALAAKYMLTYERRSWLTIHRPE